MNRALLILLLIVISISCHNDIEDFRLAPQTKSRFDFIYNAHLLGPKNDFTMAESGPIPTLIGNIDSLFVDNPTTLPYKISQFENEDGESNSSYIVFSDSIIKLSFKNSIIYVSNPYGVGMAKRYQGVVTGFIKDKEIILDNGLKIGLTRKKAYEKMFNRGFVSKYRHLLEEADTLNIDDQWFMFRHQYIFKSEKLKEINLTYMR